MFNTCNIPKISNMYYRYGTKSHVPNDFPLSTRTSASPFHKTHIYHIRQLILWAYVCTQLYQYQDVECIITLLLEVEIGPPLVKYIMFIKPLPQCSFVQLPIMRTGHPGGTLICHCIHRVWVFKLLTLFRFFLQNCIPDNCYSQFNIFFII